MPSLVTYNSIFLLSLTFVQTSVVDPAFQLDADPDSDPFKSFCFDADPDLVFLK